MLVYFKRTMWSRHQDNKMYWISYEIGIFGTSFGLVSFGNLFIQYLLHTTPHSNKISQNIINPNCNTMCMYQKCVAVYSWKIKKMQQTNSFSTIIRGPLFICLSLALILCTKAPAKQTSHVFSTVFIVMWIGSLIVTINAQLLGASISIFQSLCVSKRFTAL